MKDILLVVLFLLLVIFLSPYLVGKKEFEEVVVRQLPEDLIYTCEECKRESLPLPIFRICPNASKCSPLHETYVEAYLDEKPLMSFVVVPSIAYTTSTYTPNQTTLIDGKNVVLDWIAGTFWINGTNRFKVLSDVPFKVTYLYNKIVYPGTYTTLINFYTHKSEFSDGTIIFYERNKKDAFLESLLESRVRDVIHRINRITGRNVTYRAYLMPSTFALHYVGGAGAYLGDGIIIVNYGDYPNITQIEAEVAHEYTHAIQFKDGPFLEFKESEKNGYYGIQSCFAEGLADALTVYLGYKEPYIFTHGSYCVEKDTPIGDLIGKCSGNEKKFKELITEAEKTDQIFIQRENLIYFRGCPSIKYIDVGPWTPHLIGRCIFGFINNETLFSDEFFRRIFTPIRKYEFNSCDIMDKTTADSYLSIFSYATGIDMTNIMKYKIGANITS